MIWELLILGVLFFLITLAYFVVYSGLFHKIDICVGPPPKNALGAYGGPSKIAYKYHTGAYSKCGSFFTEVCTLVNCQLPSCGVYYDDPTKVCVSVLSDQINRLARFTFR